MQAKKCGFIYILLHAAIYSDQHHLLKMLSCFFFLPMCIFGLSKFRCSHVCGFMSCSSITFNSSMCLFLCQYHAVFITIALQYSLKLGIVRPLSIVFITQDCFSYPVFFSISSWKLSFLDPGVVLEF